ncbi:hypothetical protein Sango_3024700 [Sesamum angolense]|uniref:MULE transposase domain-containing protein n=1 Tax=Sesamum angolense TaxID=2727404 RepID=A0AAE1VZ77_9LAMI|nr:hypothetical protein Sango_3024700 [Sesamum angolense]
MERCEVSSRDSSRGIQTRILNFGSGQSGSSRWSLSYVEGVMDELQLVLHCMEDHNFVVGQEFPDVKAFRSALKKLQLLNTLNSVSLKVISFEERLRDNINYKPKDISRDVYEQYGITIPYKQAWRAKERGLQAIYGSSEEGYYLLPSYCEQIRKHNPGSVAEVFTAGADNRFQRVFVSFYASICGFLQGCLPIVGLGAIQLKSKYLGTLLSATSFDGDGGLFPLAIAVVDIENDESWMWFLSELHKALEMNTEIIPNLTFLSKGQKGIVDAVKRKFPTSCHAICMKHLTESIGREFKNPRLVQLLWKAAYATTAIGFKEKMFELEEVSSEAAKWLQQYPPSRWALIYFEGSRYGHLSSNIEEFHQWVLEARELPVIQVIEQIHLKLMAEFEERCAKSLVSSKKDVYAFTGKYFTVASYCGAYAEEIHRIPGKIEWKKDGENDMDDEIRVVRPPKVRRPPGRPEKKRMCIEELNREKHTVHCSRCNQTGHYKSTCKSDVCFQNIVPVSKGTDPDETFTTRSKTASRSCNNMGLLKNLAEHIPRALARKVDPNIWCILPP